MIRKWLGVMTLVLIGASLLSVSSCARNQHLVSINIQPGNGTFFSIDPTAFFLYKAYGTYKHPPQTIDITNQVTWQSDNPQVAHFTSPGVVAPNTNCGVAQIFASLYDSPNDITSNLVSITVDGPASQGCPNSGATNNLSVDVTANAADGVITSAPTGITCGSTCSAAFPTGSTIALTAAPNAGKSFLGWQSGCTSVTGNGSTCNVTLNTDVTVTASFN